MPEEVNPRKVQSVVKEGFDRHKRFRRSRAMFLREYVGHCYRGEGVTGNEPLNMIFHVIRSMVPSLVMRNPLSRVSTEIAEYKPYAYLLGLSLDRLSERLKLKTILRRAIVDSFFAMGIVKTGLSSTDKLLSFGDMRIDPGQVFADNVDFDDWVADPSCAIWDEASFLGHRSRVPRQLLLDDNDTNHDIVAKLPRSHHQDAKRRADSLSGKVSHSEMAELQDFVDVVELYIPGANSTILIPDPEQYMSDDYIKIQDYYGPKEGPYHILSLTQPVPGNPFPIAPVGIWYDLHVMTNRLMRKQMERSDNQKTVIVFDPGAADQAEDLRDAADGEIIPGNPDATAVVSTPGAEKEAHEMLGTLQVWFNYMSGNPDQMSGLQSNAETATQAVMLETNANVTLEDSRDMIYDFTAGIERNMAWYLHYDPFIKGTFIARQADSDESLPEGVEPGQSLVLTPAQRRGEHLHYTFKIKPRSMGGVNPTVMLQRLIDFATKVVPSLSQTAMVCMQMGMPFNLQRSISTIADRLDISDVVQEWFDDPEFMQKIQMMMAMGPQAEGKAQPGGGLAGIMQNGGSPVGATRNRNPLSQNAQGISGDMQSGVINRSVSDGGVY